MSATEESNMSFSNCFNTGSYVAGKAGFVDLKIVLKKQGKTEVYFFKKQNILI